MLYVTSHSFLLETCVSPTLIHAALYTRGCAHGCPACTPVWLPGLFLYQLAWGGAGGGLSSPKGTQVTLAGREDHLAPFSVRGTALDVGTFVIGDMGKDNSLRHHLCAVIDELGLRAPPPPTSPSRPVPPSSSCLH